MKSGFDFTEFAPPTPNAGLARAAALLIKQELWGHLKPTEIELDNTLARHIIAAHNEQGDVLAAGSLLSFGSDEFVINELVTVPEHRGEGLATQITEHLEAAAQRAGASTLSLYSPDESKGF